MQIKHSRLTTKKSGDLITEWIHKTPARVAARKLNLNHKTTDLWYSRIRYRILEVNSPPVFRGEVEIDETYLGKKRPGIRGTGTADKVPVFGILERKTKHVWTIIPEGTSHVFLLPIIQQRIAQGSTIYSDGFGAYSRLSSLGYKHRIVPHAHTFSRRNGVHSNGIESFWSYLKYTLYSKRGLPRRLYNLHVQEAVFRWNNPDPHKLRYVIKKMLNFSE